LIHKKGSADLPENFRPITLQPVGYKILSSIIRLRVSDFLIANKLVNTSIQKGFWPKSNGVTEHTAILSHLIEEGKRHQRSLVVTLLDLRNAFGEVSHDLVTKSLELHQIPSHIINLVSDIYSKAKVAISVNGSITDCINVSRGVLQGDPCSPLFFNICFNTLIRTINQDKFKQLGFAWGTDNNQQISSWLQFADDAALISHDCKSAQTLIDIASSWCNWAGMCIRPDKCISFGMAKMSGTYSQYEPKLFLGSNVIPPVKCGDSFKYLGKIFSFNMDNKEIKDSLIKRLKDILDTISNLSVPLSLKLRIVRLYIPSQFNFELQIYSLSLIWITDNLDQQIVNALREWLTYPISSCVAEIAGLPFSKGGLNIPSLRNIAEKHLLSTRSSLKLSSDTAIDPFGRKQSLNTFQQNTAYNVTI
jgi:hypothetical protein